MNACTGNLFIRREKFEVLIMKYTWYIYHVLCILRTQSTLHYLASFFNVAFFFFPYFDAWRDDIFALLCWSEQRKKEEPTWKTNVKCCASVSPHWKQPNFCSFSPYFIHDVPIYTHVCSILCCNISYILSLTY